MFKGCMSVGGVSAIFRRIVMRGLRSATADDFFIDDEDMEVEVEALPAACQSGDVRAVKNLLAAGEDPNKASSNGFTILGMAVFKGHLQVVKCLLEAGADPGRSKTATGWMPLVIAAVKGYSAIVRLLLDAGAEVNNDGGMHMTPVCAAAHSGCLEMIQWIVEAGADLETCPPEGLHPLLLAAGKRRQLPVVKLLLALGAQVDHASPVYGTPLFAASLSGDLPTVKQLVESGAEVNKVARVSNGHTALFGAAQNGNTAVTKFLVEKGADPNIDTAEGGVTPLMAAAHDGHLGVVRALVEGGADVEKSDPDGLCGTPLIAAVSGNNLEIVRYLLACGVDKNKTIEAGFTALSAAAQYGYLEIARCLVAAGADLNAATSENVTPVHYAAKAGYWEIVRCLAKAGANLDKSAISGLTPLLNAVWGGHRKAVMCLIEAGADVNKLKDDGCSALHAAVSRGQPEIIKILLQAGADDPGLWGLRHGGKAALETSALLLKQAKINRANLREQETPVKAKETLLAAKQAEEPQGPDSEAVAAAEAAMADLLAEEEAEAAEAAMKGAKKDAKKQKKKAKKHAKAEFKNLAKVEVETSASAPAELHECSPRPLSQSPTQPEHGPRPVPFSPTQPEHGSQFPALSGTRGRVRASSQLSADLAEPIVLGWGGTEDMAGGGWGAEAERLRRPVWGNSTSGGKASLAGPRSGPGQGGSSMKSLLEEFVCPITQVLFVDPVIAADGFTYERSAIEDWLSRKQTSPMTNDPLPHKQLVPNNCVRSVAQGLRQSRVSGLH